MITSRKSIILIVCVITVRDIVIITKEYLLLNLAHTKHAISFDSGKQMLWEFSLKIQGTNEELLCFECQLSKE